MKIVLIAAIGENFELGKKQNLIWHLPQDLQFFKEKTWDQVIVMGRNTFHSLPRLLPHRKHVVLTSSYIDFGSEVDVCHSVQEVIERYQSYDQIFIIGGGQVYQAFIDFADEMYLTHIHESDEDADIYFPSFKKEEWDTCLIASRSDNGVCYDHIYYRKR